MLRWRYRSGSPALASSAPCQSSAGAVVIKAAIHANTVEPFRIKTDSIAHNIIERGFDGRDSGKPRKARKLFDHALKRCDLAHYGRRPFVYDISPKRESAEKPVLRS